MSEKGQEDANESASKAAVKPETPGSGRGRHRTMLVRYGKMNLLGQFRHHEREISPTTKYVVVQTERGMEIGEIISTFCHHRGNCTLSNEMIDAYCQASGPNYPFNRQGRFVRFANEQDLNEQRHLDMDVREKVRFCEQLIQESQLLMRLVTAEHLFGGDRIIYYFTADGRVDFRELVKKLAHEYQTRIEMRQIGARDEARLIADFETCGRQCCCKSFLKVLLPVNMRMAKLQKATLDPSKISGRCGRLKCCLRYEDQVYNELNKNMPPSNSWVRTEHGLGQVIEKQVLTQLVKLRLDTGRIIALNVEEILERNCPAPEGLPIEPDQDVPEEMELKTGFKPQPTSEPTGDEVEQETPKKRRRRKKRRKKESGGSSNAAGAGQEGQQQNKSVNDAGASSD